MQTNHHQTQNLHGNDICAGESNSVWQTSEQEKPKTANQVFTGKKSEPT